MSKLSSVRLRGPSSAAIPSSPKKEQKKLFQKNPPNGEYCTDLNEATSEKERQNKVKMSSLAEGESGECLLTEGREQNEGLSS
jgi:hypothetical protein